MKGAGFAACVILTIVLLHMLQGILRKPEGLLKRHKKRWFILSTTDNFLRYYSSSNGSLQGEIDLHSIIDVRPLKDGRVHSKHPFGFQVTTDVSNSYISYNL